MNKLLILSLLLLSCGNGTEIKKDLDKLCLKPITIPTGLTVNYNGSDSNINVLNNTYLKFVVYIDSVSCSSCYVNKMYLWQPFLKYSDTFDWRLKFYFIFHPAKGGCNSLRSALKNNQLNFFVLIDENGEFEKSNLHLPRNKQLHTFLLDENNNVIFVGNPLNNREVEKMFYQKTQELLRK